jgi:prolyl 4-hydroxylase
MANIFIHFEPTGRKIDDTDNSYLDTLPEMLPPYLIPGSPWEEDWLSSNPNGWRRPAPSEPKLTSKSITTHHAAATGDVEVLRELAKKDKKLLHVKDENGWQPIHEAIRKGHLGAVKLLLDNGADKNAVAGEIGTSLFLAREYLTADHPVVRHLESLGALEAAADEL